MLLERCDATMKTIEFARLNQVLLWCMDTMTFEKVFPLFNLGGFTLFFLFNNNGKSSVPITPSYFSLTYLELIFIETCIWFDQLQFRYTKFANKRSTKNYPIPHETQLFINLLI
jgi:hypothetical protein